MQTVSAAGRAYPEGSQALLMHCSAGCHVLQARPSLLPLLPLAGDQQTLALGALANVANAAAAAAAAPVVAARSRSSWSHMGRRFQYLALHRACCLCVQAATACLLVAACNMLKLVTSSINLVTL
jgi:hypothetical protein